MLEYDTINVTDYSYQISEQTDNNSMTDTNPSSINFINPRGLIKKDCFSGSIIVKSNGIRKLKSIFLVTKVSTKYITIKDMVSQKSFVNSIDTIKVYKLLSEEEVNNSIISEKSEKQAESNQSLVLLEKTIVDTSIEEKLRKTIQSNITNIWLVGPAGCGKSTIVRNLAKEMNLPYYCVSCGIGTSASEFIGYKYPTRESTKFAKYYAQPSIILIDEFTALDPSVAQVVNAALANDEIETTTGTVKRHPNCIIIATSNTFGDGADRQYVANNQLDASTIDRFVGGIIEVDYSKAYESRYDSEVNEYVNILRTFIKQNRVRKIASTRMIQAGDKLKCNGISDWKQRLIVNWSDNEKEMLKEWLLNCNRI